MSAILFAEFPEKSKNGSEKETDDRKKREGPKENTQEVSGRKRKGTKGTANMYGNARKDRRMAEARMECVTFGAELSNTTKKYLQRVSDTRYVSINDVNCYKRIVDWENEETQSTKKRFDNIAA